MARGSLMPLLTVAMVVALLVPTLGAHKVKKRDLGRVVEPMPVKGSHIDIMVSLNDEEPHSLDGGHFAAYRMGDKVTLTCITEGYPAELVNLSWWEGERSLQFIRQFAQFARSSTTSLEDLAPGDSGRTFVCRADDSTHTRTVTLQLDFSSPGDSEEVPASRMHIVVNHEVAMGGNGLLLYGAGDYLSLLCLMQEPDVKRVSWWEDENELVPNTVTVREHASSSELVLRHLSTADSGRRLSCRADDSTLLRTVELLQNNPHFGISATENQDQKTIIHIFGRSSVTSKLVNTRTLIGIWTCIFVFVVVCLCLAKLCKKTSSKASSSSTASSINQRKQPKRSSGKGCAYSPVDPTVMPQGMANRTLIFGRRFSASSLPTAFIGDAAKTHGGKKAAGEAYTNPGFVSNV